MINRVITSLILVAVLSLNGNCQNEVDQLHLKVCKHGRMVTLELLNRSEDETIQFKLFRPIEFYSNNGIVLSLVSVDTIVHYGGEDYLIRDTIADTTRENLVVHKLNVNSINIEPGQRATVEFKLKNSFRLYRKPKLIKLIYTIDNTFYSDKVYIFKRCRWSSK